MRFTMTAAEWDAADDRRKAFIAGATGFNMGVPVLDGDAYVVNHPKFRAEDAVRVTEAFNVPDVDLPPLGRDGEFPDRATAYAVVEARLRPDEDTDKIAEFLDGLARGADIDAELKGRRTTKGATPLPQRP
jgi:hypothetical protein